MAKTVRQPKIKLVYNDTDISRDIGSSLLNITYDDYYTGESDTVEFTVENRNLSWIKNWYPAKGDTVQLDIWFEGKHLACGTFEVDEIDASGPPDQVTVRGIATGFNSVLREEHTRSWEQATCGDIARDIASRAGMGSYIELDTETVIKRLEQNLETDLAFLTRLAAEYGIVFRETGNTIYYISRTLLENRPYTYIMRRQYCSRYSFRDTAQPQYKGVSLTFLDGESGETQEYTRDWPGASGSYLRINTRFDSEEEAAAKAAALYREHNGKGESGSFTSAGNAKLLAGMVLLVEGWGVYDGNWYITHTSHSMSRDSGYSTTIEVQRVMEEP